MAEPTSDSAEARKILRTFRVLAIIVAGVFAGGATFYHFLEGWSWVDSFYFTVVSLATVGYGDLAPKTDAGKIFTIFYLMIGLGLFAAFINNLVKSRLAKHQIRKGRKD